MTSEHERVHTHSPNSIDKTGDSDLRQQLNSVETEKAKLESTLAGVKIKVHKLFAEQQDQHKVGTK